MDRRWGPIAAGLVAGLVSAVVPDTIGLVVLLVATLAAGWLLPEAPVRAALLFVLPAVAIGLVRMVVGDRSDAVGAFIVGSIVAVVVAAIFTHVGAGLALRRREAWRPPPTRG